MLSTQCKKCGWVDARRMTHKYRRKDGSWDISYHVIPSCVHGKWEVLNEI